MNNKRKQKLIEKKEMLESSLEHYRILSVEDFKWSDPLFGAFGGLLLMGIFMWIPIIGWVLMPFCIPVGAFMGTKIRQDSNSKKAEKAEKELEKIVSVLGAYQ